LARTESTGRFSEEERPLGQFQFGPPGLIADLPGAGFGYDQTGEAYQSLHDLEAAFDDRYVPPPECYAFESDALMVKCANHRIRARREFIESRGQITPMLLGSWEEPRDGLAQTRPQEWREYKGSEWDQYVPADEPDDREYYQGWGSQPYQVQEATPGPEQDWRQSDPQVQHRDWEQAQRQHPRSDWRRQYARDWAQEPAGQPSPAPQENWRQEWTRDPGQESGGGRQQEWIQDPAQEQARDWRRGWLQAPQQETGGHWGRERRSDPVPGGRRHWVDDF
jgi:hypothetical protein